MFWPSHKIYAKINISWGGETIRAGTRTSASGVLRSAAAKKAIGEALSSDLAELNSSTKGKQKTTKGANKNSDKGKSKEEKELKDMQKTIKQLPNFKYYLFIFQVLLFGTDGSNFSPLKACIRIRFSTC